MSRRYQFLAKLSVERLEARHMLAGNVMLSLSSGNLRIQGDGADNALAVTSGKIPGSIVVTGFSTAAGQPTMINGRANAAVQINGVTGSVLADLGAGRDTLGLTNLKLTRDLTIIDSSGESTIYMGRLSAPDPSSPLSAVTNGPVKIDGNVSIATGPGADFVVIGEYGSEQALAGAAVTIGGSLSASLGAGATQNYFGPDDVLNVGRFAKAAHFAVRVGQNFLGNLGTGKGLVEVTSLLVGGSLDIGSSNEGAYGTARVFVGHYNTAGPTALQVNGDANIHLGPGNDTVEMFAFSIGGSFTLDIPAALRYSGSETQSFATLGNGTIGGTLKITIGTGDVQVNVLGTTANSLVIVGSSATELVTVGATEAGRRCQFGTMSIDLLGGDDYLSIDNTTVLGLATLDGGAGEDTFWRDTRPGSVVFGRLKLIGF